MVCADEDIELFSVAFKHMQVAVYLSKITTQQGKDASFRLRYLHFMHIHNGNLIYLLILN